MFNYLIPIITIIILIYGIYKRVNIFDIFLLGVKEGLETSIHLFPTIFAMVIAVNLLTSSGILSKYGPDSFIGRVSSVMQGSTDTTIYIISLYFASVGVKKIRYSLIVGLLSDLVSIILSIIIVSLLFNN